MNIFDGTNRPSLSLTVDGVAIPDTDILEFTFFRGRQLWDEPLQIGKCTISLNNPNNNYSNFAAASIVELKMDSDTVFYGFVKAAPVMGNINPVVRLEAWDAVWKLEQAIVTEEYLNAYSLETTDTRANRIYTDYPQGLTSYVTTGFSGSTNMISSFGNISAMTALEQCRDTEVGVLYVDRQGGLYVASNQDKNGRSTAIEFTDDNTGSGGAAPYFGANITPASAYLINSCTAERVDRVGNSSTAITATYDSSVTNFGLQQRKWQTWAYTDESVRACAQYVAKLYSSGDNTVSKLEFYGTDFTRNGATYSQLTALDIGDKVEITRSIIPYNCLIEGISHSATGNTWVVRLWLSPYNSYTEDIATGTTPPQTGFTFAEGPATRIANSFDVKWEDFSDRGAASGGTSTPLVMWANRKQIAVYDSNSTGAYQFNFRGGYVDGTSANDLKMSEVLQEDQCVTFHILVKCNNTSHYANSTIKIDGSTTNVTTIWIGGAPSAGKNGGWDSYNVTVYLVDSTTSPATYRVEASHGASA